MLQINGAMPFVVKREHLCVTIVKNVTVVVEVGLSLRDPKSPLRLYQGRNAEVAVT